MHPNAKPPSNTENNAIVTKSNPKGPNSVLQLLIHLGNWDSAKVSHYKVFEGPKPAARDDECAAKTSVCAPRLNDLVL